MNDSKKYITEKYVRALFDVSIIIKGIDGLLETMGGTLLLFIKPTQLTAIVKLITQRELIEDPKDIIVNYLLNASHHFSLNVELFVAIYLLIHGAIKIIIVVGLLKNKLWAYPLGILVFSAFVLYQIYQYIQSYSVSLIIFTIFDVFLIFITWYEYTYRKGLTISEHR